MPRIATNVSLKITFGLSGYGKEQCNWWSAACGDQYDWRNPNNILVIQESTDRQEAKVFRAQVVPQGVCDNLVKALKILANQHQSGDIPVKIWSGYESSSRRTITKRLEVGDLEKAESRVVGLEIAAGFPEAVVREGADELTLR